MSLERTWNYPAFKVLRWILYIPLAIMSSWILVYLFSILIDWVINLKVHFFWLALFLFFGWGIAWAFLKLISAYLITGLALVCPNIKAGTIVIGVIWTVVWTVLIISIWYNQGSAVLKIITSILALSLWFNMMGVLIMRRKNTD